MHERVGDTLTPDSCQTRAANTGSTIYRKAPVAPTGCAPTGWVPSVWARAFGQQINDHYKAFADPRAEGMLAGFQSGFDLLRGEWIPGHRDAAGIYMAYANAGVDVNGLVTNPAATGYLLKQTGALNLNAWSGGIYWTHYGPGEWYVDAVLQATRYEGSATTEFVRLPTKGYGFLSSLETGLPIAVPLLGPGFVIEPQAQIIWQRVSFDGANDGLGDVALGTTSGTTGRIGVRGRWTLISANGQVWQPYVRANLWRDWGAQETTVYSGVDTVPLREQATRVDLGGGLTTRVSTNLSLYAQGGYQFAAGNTDGGRRDGVKGDIGGRYTW